MQKGRKSVKFKVIKISSITKLLLLNEKIKMK